MELCLFHVAIDNVIVSQLDCRVDDILVAFTVFSIAGTDLPRSTSTTSAPERNLQRILNSFIQIVCLFAYPDSLGDSQEEGRI